MLEKQREKPSFYYLICNLGRPFQTGLAEYLVRFPSVSPTNIIPAFSANGTYFSISAEISVKLASEASANRSGERNPNRYYMLEFIKQRISDGSLRAENFASILEEVYLVQPAVTVGETTFRDEIRRRLPQLLDQIISAGSNNKFVSEALIPKPMRSLRDVDEAVDIELDSAGTQWSVR